MSARLLQRLRDPVSWTNASQLLKTVLAAVLAWVLVARVLDLPQAFIAPWAALLTVQATVFGSVRLGLGQAAASVVGVLVAFAAGRLFGIGAVSVGVSVLAGLLAGSVRPMRAQATTAAATAVVVLSAGYSARSGMLVDRLVDTGIGIAAGLLVNLLVWPPLRDRTAAHEIDVLDDLVAKLLSLIATGLRHGGDAHDPDGWIAKTEKLDGDIKRASSYLQEARESGRLNPRRAVPTRMQATAGFDVVLGRLDHAVAETRSMSRTIQLARVPPSGWDPHFREPWLELLERAGAALGRADVGAVRAVRADLSALADRLRVEDFSHQLWPVYGALTVNLRNVLDSMDVVAEAQPVEVPRVGYPRPARPSRKFATQSGSAGSISDS